MKFHVRSYSIPYQLVFIFSVLAIIIVATGYVYNEHQKEQTKKDVLNGLSTVADLKISQIANWRRERLGDAEIIWTANIIAAHVHQFLKNHDTPGYREGILSLMKSLQSYNYRNVLLLDAKGVVRLSTSPEDEKIGNEAEKALKEAIASKKVVLSDFHTSENANYVHLDLVAPLLVHSGRDSVPIGALLLRIDPNQFLYPLIQLWPTPSPTAETLLVQREGDNVLFLNKLRHRNDPPLSLRFPLNKKDLPAAMAVSGREGFIEGLDYRGKKVIAALRAIPDTPWFLVSKIDTDEVYSPIRERARLVEVITGILVLAAGLSIGLWWRQKSAEILKQNIAERIVIEDRLKAALREKEVLLKEIHHRVKNNLQIISSMLQLQSGYFKDEQTLMTFRESQNRIDTMALIHEKLYHSKDLAKINFAEYVEELTTNLIITYGVNPEFIQLKADIAEVFFDVNTSIPCGLIINELVSNALKHAFPKGLRGEINISFKPEKTDKFIFVISDNGVGFPEGTDFRNTKTLGLKLVTSLTNQLDGTIELIRDKGTTIRIIFKELKYKERG